MLEFIVAHGQTVVAAVLAILGGVIAIAALIPGPEPERTLQKVVDFISKFSRK